MLLDQDALLDMADALYNDVADGPLAMWSAARSSKATCTVWVRSTENRPDYLCSALVHEVGHFALTGTSADHSWRGKHGVMRTGDFGPCYARFPPRAMIRWCLRGRQHRPYCRRALRNRWTIEG